MDTDESSDAIQESLKEIRGYGINSVLAFIIEVRLTFRAHSYNIFKKAIDSILDEKTK